MQGTNVNGYILKRLLGEGGMAEVWYAENEIGMPAAVKILYDKMTRNEQMLERFHNEAVLMVKLKHPNIRQVYGYGYIGNRHCSIMEYLDGNDLGELLRDGRRFTDEELSKWWNQIADALNFTHAQGIVHRDIKPSNIFLDKDGNVKLLDFGIAKMMEDNSMTRTGSLMGTLMYMSPEQVNDTKHVDYHTDLYSLAVTFVHLLTGKAPYDESSSSYLEIPLSIVTKPLDLSEVPPEWQEFLNPYLAKNPTDRPPLTHCMMFETSPIPSNQVPDSEAYRLLLEENRLLKERNRELELLLEELRAKEESYSYSKTVIGENETGEAGEFWNVEQEDDLIDKTIMVENETGDATVVGNANCENDLIIDVNGVPLVMKRVETGTFWMGAHKTCKKSGLFSKEPDYSIPNYDSDANDDEEPVHSVSLSSFYIGETVVTQELWKALMGNNLSVFKGDSRPVENVSYNDIVNDFLPKLNELTGKKFRLPTEAEWEYAARGGNRSKHYKFAGSSYDADEVAWYSGTFFQEGTQPVKSKAPNELGLFDMSGNVWEWCQDWYLEFYYSKSPSNNPQGPEQGSYRVLRGGCWSGYEGFCRVSSRGYFSPDSRCDRNGFRLALSE